MMQKAMYTNSPTEFRRSCARIQHIHRRFQRKKRRR